MKTYGLPVNSQLLKNDVVFDMSKLNFPVDNNKQIRSALLYLRNTGFKPSKFDFTSCSYSSKSEFLILLMRNNRLNVDIKPLVTTWIKILSVGVIDIQLESILSEYELLMFIDTNKNLVDELRKLLVSIPLCAMCIYNSSGTNNINMNDFKINNFNDFNPYTIINLLEYDECTTIVRLINDIIPEYYKFYFDPNNECMHGFINLIINKFPYLSLLNIIMSDDNSIVEKFINGMSELLNQ